MIFVNIIITLINHHFLHKYDLQSRRTYMFHTAALSFCKLLNANVKKEEPWVIIIVLIKFLTFKFSTYISY